MLCRSRTLTPAALAARRSNALKSTGPRTDRGKARVALNRLKHGRYAVNLPEKLVRAGYRQGEAEWRRIRRRIAQTFQPTLAVPEPCSGGVPTAARPPEPCSACSGGVLTAARSVDRRLGSTISGPSFEKKMDWLANSIWCAHRSWQEHLGSKLKSLLESENQQATVTDQLRIQLPPQIRIYNPWARLGLVFYLQRRRGYEFPMGNELYRSRLPAGRGPEWETGLRCRVYPLGRPRFWERIRYCLDQEGNYHPEWQGRYRKVRREIRNSSMAGWLEPYPILTEQWQQEEREAWHGRPARAGSEEEERETEERSNPGGREGTSSKNSDHGPPTRSAYSEDSRN